MEEEMITEREIPVDLIVEMRETTGTIIVKVEGIEGRTTGEKTGQIEGKIEGRKEVTEEKREGMKEEVTEEDKDTDPSIAD